MNHEKYPDLIDLFNTEPYIKSFGCALLRIGDNSAVIAMPLPREYANFSNILWGGITAMLADIAAPMAAYTRINRETEAIRLHTCTTRLLKPILFEDERLILAAEIADDTVGTSGKGFPRRKITVKTRTLSEKTKEEKAVHMSWYDVLPKTVDARLIARERSKITL